MSFNDFKKIRETTGGAKGTPTGTPTAKSAPAKAEPAPEKTLESLRPLETQDD